MSIWENILWHIVAAILFVIIWFYLAKHTNFVTDLRAPKCVCTCEERK